MLHFLKTKIAIHTKKGKREKKKKTPNFGVNGKKNI